MYVIFIRPYPVHITVTDYYRGVDVDFYLLGDGPK